MPPRLAALAVTLTAKVKSLSQDKPIDLAAGETFALNGIDKTDKIEDLHLAKFGADYVIELLRPDRRAEAGPAGAAGAQAPRLQRAGAGHAEDRRPRPGRARAAGRHRQRRPRPARKGRPTPGRCRSTGTPIGSVVDAKAGETVTLPYLGTAAAPTRAELALFEVPRRPDPRRPLRRPGDHATACWSCAAWRPATTTSGSSKPASGSASASSTGETVAGLRPRQAAAPGAAAAQAGADRGDRRRRRRGDGAACATRRRSPASTSSPRATGRRSRRSPTWARSATAELGGVYPAPRRVGLPHRPEHRRRVPLRARPPAPAEVPGQHARAAGAAAEPVGGALDRDRRAAGPRAARSSSAVPVPAPATPAAPPVRNGRGSESGRGRRFRRPRFPRRAGGRARQPGPRQGRRRPHRPQARSGRTP